MSTVPDVAAFAQQLKQDGIDAARAEAEKILAEARSKSAALEAEGKQAAQRLLEQAKVQIEKDRSRSEADLQLVARDLVLAVRGRLQDVLAKVLQAGAASALSSKDVVEKALLEMVKGAKAGGNWQVALGADTAKALTETALKQVFTDAGQKVVLGAALKEAGFEVRLPDSPATIEVTASSVADAFRHLLSPELAKLVEKAMGESGKPGKDAGKR